MTRAVTARSFRLEGIEAGRQAARNASKLGGADADLVLVFAAAGYDHSEVLRGVTEIFAHTPLSGCSVEGVITDDGSSEDTHVVAVMALASPVIDVTTFLAGGVTDDLEACARSVVDEVGQERLTDGGLMLIFPPGLTSNSRELLEKLDERLPDSVVISGGGASNILSSGTPNENPTVQFRGQQTATHHVAGVFISGDFETEIAVSHGCVPIGLERTVTRARGPIVEEIDGQPAWEIFNRYLPRVDDGREAVDLIHLSVGVKLPDKLTGDYGDYLIRSPSVIDEEENSLFFPGVVDEGAEITMVLREPERIADDARRCARGLSQRRDEEPAFVLQFDCAGRGRFLFGQEATAKAITPLRQEFGDDVTWFGFHPFGEIAPLGNRAYFHNYTVVLCAVYPNRTSPTVDNVQ